MKEALFTTLTLLIVGLANSSYAGGNDQCFLKIDGIPGESTVHPHVGEIDLVGFRTGLCRKSSIPVAEVAEREKWISDR
jgi:type VI protein secretion system component Hcp